MEEDAWEEDHQTCIPYYVLSLSASRGGGEEEEEEISKLLPFLALIFQKGTDFVEIGALIE